MLKKKLEEQEQKVTLLEKKSIEMRSRTDIKEEEKTKITKEFE